MKNALTFLWWNLNAFSHYDESRAGEVQWPISLEEYAEKCQRVDRVLRSLSDPSPPDVLAFAELTRSAASDLCRRLFPEHEVFSLDDLARPELQVGFLYRKDGPFEVQQKVVVPRLPRGTRPMAVLDHVMPGHRIRFFACHWTARFGQESTDHRSDAARHLNGEIYRFLHPTLATGEARHVVVLGDLNEEPYHENLERRFHASRDRGRSRKREHYSDKDMERVHLYNCSWRLLGERQPHDGGPPQASAAGTYYWERERTWHTLDHVIVSGGLLTEAVPFLDEARLEVLAGSAVWGTDGMPLKFQWKGGAPVGVSDHLPIRGRIVLNGGGANANL